MMKVHKPIAVLLVGCEERPKSKFDEEVTIVAKADDRQVVAEKAALAARRDSETARGAE